MGEDEKQGLIEMMLEITFIRNGKTAFACEGKFIGRTDEPLCEEGKTEIYERVKKNVYPKVSRVYTGGYNRCRETAAIIYPRIPALLESVMDSFDFGDFEGKSYSEILNDDRFGEWAGSEAMKPFPGGENPQLSVAVILRGFGEIIDDLEHSSVNKAAVITHKSAIIAILRRYMLMGPHYLETDIQYGGGITVLFDTKISALRIKNTF